jgi:hypothetical protein
VSYGQSKVERINPTDMHVNERTAGRSGGLFVWVAGMRGSESKGTGAMPTGLFITSDQSVQVDYDGVSIPIPRSTYENNGYKPDFGNLPLEAEYRAAKEKSDNVPSP